MGAWLLSCQHHWTEPGQALRYTPQNTTKTTHTHTQAEGQRAGKEHSQQIVRSELRGGGSGNGETGLNKWKKNEREETEEAERGKSAPERSRLKTRCQPEISHDRRSWGRTRRKWTHVGLKCGGSQM